MMNLYPRLEDKQKDRKIVRNGTRKLLIQQVPDMWNIDPINIHLTGTTIPPAIHDGKWY
ncbi:MAG: hypothetical protein ACETWE_08210 [Candidatus Bathyarchaeia archaeon]